MAFQANAFQVSGNKAFQSGGAVVVTPPSTDSGMAVGYSYPKLRKWIEELKKARAAVAAEARKASGKRKEQLLAANLAAEEVLYAAIAAASDKVDAAKAERATRRVANSLNAAVGASTVAAAIKANRIAHEYANEMEEDEDISVIIRLLH